MSCSSLNPNPNPLLGQSASIQSLSVQSSAQPVLPFSQGAEQDADNNIGRHNNVSNLVRLHFDDDTYEDVDVLVAADGIYSTISRQLLNEYKNANNNRSNSNSDSSSGDTGSISMVGASSLSSGIRSAATGINSTDAISELSLSYLGLMVILGISPSLDATTVAVGDRYTYAATCQSSLC